MTTQHVAGPVEPGAVFEALFAGASNAFWVDRPDGSSLLGESGEVVSFDRADDRFWTWAAGTPRPGRPGRPDGPSASPEGAASSVEGGWVGYLAYEGHSRWMRAGLTVAIDAQGEATVTGDEDGVARVVDVLAAHVSVRDRRSVRDDLAGSRIPDGGGEGTRRRSYVDAIARIKEHLAAGESYEVCLTRTVTLPPHPDPLALHRAMRATSPTGRNVYLRFGDLAIASATPEEFLTVTADGTVRSSPIKGTAPRYADPDRDAASAAALTSDDKTRAENLMIVDLVRNDLNRVCEPGSVTVPRFLAVESYATVHQLVSTITGQLPDGSTRADAIRSAFPPGSMTGAPKERTMAIIDALEPVPRGVYSGAIGLLTPDGGADLRVVIRTAITTPESTTIGTGGAIVWASDPEAEWEETVLKLDAVLSAYDLTRAG